MRKTGFGFALATLAGWIASWGAVELMAYCYPDGTLKGPWDSLLMLIPTGFAVWFMSCAVFLRIYFDLPRSNLFWNPIVCLPLGGVAGVVASLGVASAWQDFSSFDFNWKSLIWFIPGAIAGFTICLVAAITYSWFHPEPNGPVAEIKSRPRSRWLFIGSLTSQVTLRAIFFIEEYRQTYYNRYDPYNHPILGAFISCTFALSGLFVIIYTPRFFHKLGYWAIPVWLASVFLVGEFLLSWNRSSPTKSL